MAKIEDAKQPEKVYVLKEEHKGFKPTVKKVGRDPKLKGDKSGVIFMSPTKAYQIFKEDGSFIQFANQMYITNDKEDIEFLKGHDMFGIDFWEGEFPDYVIKKMEKDREFITRSEETFTVPEA